MSAAQDSNPVIEQDVREVTNLLSKAAKNYQMYLSNNRMFLASLDQLKSALDRFLEDNDVLTFVVREFELVHHNVPVYSNTDKYQSIAFRMYRDGIRLISFHKGISKDDLLAFFEVLTRCMETDNLEEDLVTLLWEKDLHAITYYEVNDFEADYAKLMRGTRRKPGEVPRFEAPDLPQADRGKVTRDVEKLKPTLTLTPEDLREVQEFAFAVEDDFFLERAWQILRLTLDSDRAKDTYVDLETALTGYLDTCVAKKQFGLAAEVLSEIRSRYGAIGHQEVAQALSGIVASAHNEKNMGAIGESLSSDKEAEHDQCLAYLSQLSKEAIPAILRLLPQCGRESARQAILSALASIAKKCPRDIIMCADVTSPEEIELVLDTLEEIGTESALSCAMQFHEHASARVRSKVALLAGRLKSEKASQVAEALIRDQDHSVRRRALASLVEIRGEQCVDTLIDLFTSKEFHLISHDCKLSMLLTIRSLPPPSQKQVIQTILEARSFFGRKSLDDTKTALVGIIHLMDKEVAWPLLERLTRGSSEKLRKAAEAALRKAGHVQRMH